MKSMHRLFCVLLFCSGGSLSQTAHAGIPVIDVASFQQAILEVLNSAQQISNQITQITNQVTEINNQIKQIQQLQQQFDALTGSRNLGEILNNPLLHNYVPPDLVDNYNDLRKGYGELKGLAKQLRDENMIYNCLDKPLAQIPACQERFAKPYQEKATMQQALTVSTQRLNQINALMGQINATTDPKSIAEVSARIGAENAMLLHELIRTQLTLGMFQAEQRIETARAEERRLQVLSRKASVVP